MRASCSHRTASEVDLEPDKDHLKRHLGIFSADGEWDDDSQSYGSPDYASAPGNEAAASSTNAAGTAGGSGGSTSTATSFAAAGTSAQHLTINLSFDASVNAAPAGFKSAVLAAAQFFENTFVNPVTVNIAVGYGEIAGYSLAGALGESDSFLYGSSYSQLAAALSAASPAAAASLPAADPTGGGQFYLTTAEAKALGLAGNSQGTDGYVGFSSSYAFCYNDSNGVPSGQFDLFGVAAHEFSEVLGRQMMDGAGNGYEPLDLFHYSAPGVRSFSGTQTGYFSTDGGATDLANFNTNPGGDFGDWASSMGNDAFVAFSNSGTVATISSADITLMSRLGWSTSPSASSPPTPRVVSDFNGDGTSDILWRNSGSGAVGLYLMRNDAVSSWNPLATVSSDWSVAGTGDFSGDGTSDILWRNGSGAVGIYLMSNGAVSSWDPLGTVSNDWSVAGIGDFNGDGTSDILWRNTASGALGIYLMKSGAVSAWDPLATVSSDWSVAGIGDFNGDGTSDILWRNTATGAVGIYLMKNGTVSSWDPLGTVSSDWSVAGIGDFNGDGTSDILWRTTASGAVGTYLMKNGAVSSWDPLATVSSDWSVAGVGDYNGDGTSDILWRNNSSGAIGLYAMSNGAVSSWDPLGTVMTSWTVQRSGAALSSA